MSYINFIDADAETILNELITAFEATYKTTLHPGDERRIFLTQLVPVIVGLKNNINYTANQNFLSNATSSVLDELGGTKTPRLAAKKASVTIRFTLSVTQLFDVTVPQGTRVTPDGKLYFATVKALTISMGQTTGDVTAEATVAGEAYNNYAAGQVKTIVDPVAYVKSAINVDTSSGGTDAETDNHYRERIRLASESISTAGPENGYIYWAKTADTNIADVSVLSPTPNNIKITVLMENGELPSSTVLNAVLAQVTPRDRRPMGDNVAAVAPTVDSYNITLTYYISIDNSINESNIRTAIEGSNGAMEQYNTWQCAKLGRAINPDYLRQLMLNAGAARINLTAPTFTEVAIDHVAKVGTINIAYGGLI